MKELIIVFNNYDCYKHIRLGLGSFIKDVVPNGATLVEVVLNEAVNNAIRSSDNNHIVVKLKIHNNGKLLIRVKDSGPGFSVKETISRVIKNNTSDELISSNKESGRGLFIIHQVMDKVIYNQKGNDVLLVKNI